MDAFADVVQGIRLTGGIFLDAEFTAPWCVSSKVGPEDCGRFLPVPSRIIAYHYVRRGRLCVEVQGEAPLTVEPGEIVILARNADHRLGSSSGLTPVDVEPLIRPGADGGLARIAHGGGGEAVRIVCGFLGSDERNDPVLALLPEVIKLGLRDDALRAWIESSLRLATRQSGVGRAESLDVLPRLAELLFIEALRGYLSALPPGSSGWRDGLRDPGVARALVAMHGRVRQRWTTEQLAREVGMSRSAFAERFTEVMAVTPIRYLAEQRLRSASRLLRESNDSLAQIASAVGYDSEAAFSRAFKREFGLPPATWRKGVRSQPRVTSIRAGDADGAGDEPECA